MERKYSILTFGCQMNKSDSERIAAALLAMGFKVAEDQKDADIIVLNTCSVRQTAEDRVYGMVRNFNRWKSQKPHLLVAVTGCVAGRDKDGKIQAKMPGVDFFFPISDLPRLPEMIMERWGVKDQKAAVKNKRVDYLGIEPKPAEWWRGCVVVQTGCSNYCTYCVVPYARGHEKNRALKDIMVETRQLVASGVKEIQLLGQTVNSWQASDRQNFSENNSFIGKGKDDFAALLWEINQIEGINRIGFFSAHPMYVNDAIIKAMKLPKMMNYLHLPIQSGNDEVLKRMNRKYTVADFLKIVKKIRRARPTLSLASDIIVGFPGETKKQFVDTVRAYKECDFDLSYNAMYSPRSGTAAFKVFPDDVSREEKRRRWLVLQSLMEKNALRKNKKFVGQTVEVLVDGCSNGKCYGFSREYKRVIFSGDKNLIGQVVNVKINKIKEWELEGESVVGS
jgi:tRNA-2-methylthio-N6-dimethylallyladenosine synthase